MIEKLPYELTGAQKKTIDEIKQDIKSPYVMQRLIQGDVGSGKTIVAFLLMAWASKLWLSVCHNGSDGGACKPAL